MSLWSNQEIETLRASLNKTPIERYQDYVINFGQARTMEAVERKVRRMRLIQNATAAITSEIEDEIQEVEDELDGVDNLLNPRELAYLSKSLGRVKKIATPILIERKADLNKLIDDIIVRSTSQEIKAIPIPMSGSSLCILLSDTHIGKQTETFDSEVFKSRLLSIPAKILQEIVPPGDLEEIVLMLAGDMLEGEGIYETQAHHIEFPVIDQIKIATETFWTLATNLAELLDVKVRIVTCPGNHGRVSKLAAEKSNFDNIIYQTLSLISSAAKNPNVSVECNFEAFLVFPVQDKVGMIFHHGTKHLGTSSMQTKVTGWLHTKEFDFMCHGHWHHWEIGTQFGRPVMKNGSLPGQDDLAERMGVYDPPRQGWLLVRSGQPINQMGFFEW